MWTNDNKYTKSFVFLNSRSVQWMTGKSRNWKAKDASKIPPKKQDPSWSLVSSCVSSIRLTLRHEGFSIVNKISILVSCVLQMCLLRVNLGGLSPGGKQREEVVGLDRQWGPGRVDEYVGHLCHLYNLDDDLDDQLIITLQYYLFVSGSVSD